MRIIEDVSNGMAELTGQYQNFSFLGKYLPWLWIFLTWCAHHVPRCAFDRSDTACRVNVILIKIPFGFLRLLGPQLWSDVSRYEGIVASGVSPQEEVGVSFRRGDSVTKWPATIAQECTVSHRQDVLARRSAYWSITSNLHRHITALVSHVLARVRD